MDQEASSTTNEYDNHLNTSFCENRMVEVVVFNPVAMKFIHRRTNPDNAKKYTTEGEAYNMCFKTVKNESKLIKTLLYSYGFLQCSAKNLRINLIWANTHLSNSTLRSIRPWQRINHFPRSWMITRKDSLCSNIERATAQYGKEWFDFMPRSYCTPLSELKRAELLEYLYMIKENNQSPFIVKPAGSSLGRGIYFLREPNQIDEFDSDKKFVICQYIDKPYLFNGLKWDLRIYVLVTSFYPLICYIYADGLARFAVNEYDVQQDYSDVNIHLTNYSLNKHSLKFIRNKDVASENVGHKWTLGALLRELEHYGVDVELLMIRIEDIVIKTLLSIQGSVAAMCRRVNLHPKCAFELFGFDILVDSDLKPWLIEVNLSPSLICDAPLDAALKTSLICDVLNIASIPYVQDKNVLNRTYNVNHNEEDDFLSDDASDHTATVSYSSDAACDLASIATTSISKSGVNDNDTRNFSFKLKGKNNDRKAHLASKVNKLKKYQTSSQRTNFSATNKNQQYQARSKLYFDKMQSEINRKGHFIPVFPRKTTWHMYNFILEDVGQEKWDEDLYNRLVEKAKSDRSYSDVNVTMEDVRKAHYQLMNAKEYKSRGNLCTVVRDVLLEEAFASAERYKMRMYHKDIIPYPSSLPRVRDDARRRTKSQTESEKEREEKIRELKRQQAAFVDGQHLNAMIDVKGSMNVVDLETALPIDQISPITVLLDTTTDTKI